MPELPEVETIKRQLIKGIKGKRIKTVKINLPKLVKFDLKEFKKKVIGSVAQDIKRRAKLLIFNLSGGYSLIIHLKLSGQLIYNGQPNKHTHLIYTFTDGSQLCHNDLRQFGYVKLILTNKLDDFFKKEKFGQEPLNKKFILDLLKQLLAKRHRSKIKPLLMDQTFLAGIGNIYSDEILFYAKVKPTRLAGSINQKEIKQIYLGTKKILFQAVKDKGSSVNDYLTAEGKKGKYMPRLKVYRREGKFCFCCHNKIERLKFNNRSAHFCPKCQK